MARASASGGSLSQPSDAITSDAAADDVAVPRAEQLGQASGEVGAAEPVDHLRLACATAASGERCASAGVSRVSDVENANVSACRVRANTRIRWRYAVA